jgi:hypothetical protein
MRTVLRSAQSMLRALRQKCTHVSRCALIPPSWLDVRLALHCHHRSLPWSSCICCYCACAGGRIQRSSAAACRHLHETNHGAVCMPLQLIKSMKTSLMKQTADALKACQAAAKPAKPAKGAAAVHKGEGDVSASTFSLSHPAGRDAPLRWCLYACHYNPVCVWEPCRTASPVKQQYAGC